MKLSAKGLLEIGGSHEGRTLKEAQEAARKIRAAVDAGKRRKAARIANEFIGGYGVEYFRTRKGGYYYANMGDTYTGTVVVPEEYQERRKGAIIIDWGTLVEAEGTEEESYF